jgi:hypothetical protein
MPDFLVAHTPTQTGKPGAIAVYDSRTGRRLRVLGAAYDPYLMNGFTLSADRATLYYTRLNEPAQHFEIVAVPVTGGRTRVIALGSILDLSPDGTSMAYAPQGSSDTLAIMNLATGATRREPVPHRQAAYRSFGAAWIGDPNHLLVVSYSVPQPPCTGPPRSSCATTPPPKQIVDAYLFDISTSRWTALPPIHGDTHSWLDIRPLAAGRSRQSIPVLLTDPTNPNRQQHLGHLNADTGTVTGTVDIPTGRTLLAASRDPTYLLLAGPTDTETWTPGSSQPTHLGPLYAEAAW